MKTIKFGILEFQLTPKLWIAIGLGLIGLVFLGFPAIVILALMSNGWAVGSLIAATLFVGVIILIPNFKSIVFTQSTITIKHVNSVILWFTAIAVISITLASIAIIGNPILIFLGIAIPLAFVLGYLSLAFILFSLPLERQFGGLEGKYAGVRLTAEAWKRGSEALKTSKTTDEK